MIKCKYRLVIQERQQGNAFKDKVRIGIEPSLYKRIFLKGKKLEEITLTEFGKRCSNYIRNVINVD